MHNSGILGSMRSPTPVKKHRKRMSSVSGPSTSPANSLRDKAGSVHSILGVVSAFSARLASTNSTSPVSSPKASPAGSLRERSTAASPLPHTTVPDSNPSSPTLPHSHSSLSITSTPLEEMGNAVMPGAISFRKRSETHPPLPAPSNPILVPPKRRTSLFGTFNFFRSSDSSHSIASSTSSGRRSGSFSSLFGSSPTSSSPSKEKSRLHRINFDLKALEKILKSKQFRAFHPVSPIDFEDCLDILYANAQLLDRLNKFYTLSPPSKDSIVKLCKDLDYHYITITANVLNTSVSFTDFAKGQNNPNYGFLENFISSLEVNKSVY